MSHTTLAQLILVSLCLSTSTVFGCSSRFQFPQFQQPFIQIPQIQTPTQSSLFRIPTFTTQRPSQPQPQQMTQDQRQKAKPFRISLTPTTPRPSPTSPTNSPPIQMIQSLQQQQIPHPSFSGYNSIYPGPIQLQTGPSPTAPIQTSASNNNNFDNFDNFDNLSSFNAYNNLRDKQSSPKSPRSREPVSIHYHGQPRPLREFRPQPHRIVQTLPISYNNDQYHQQTSPNPTCPPQDPEGNKLLVTTFYQRAFGDKNLEEIDSFLSPDLVQHNPQIGDGPQGFKDWLQNSPLRFRPRSKLDFKRVSADGDLVWVHLKLHMIGRNYAVMDVFRIECGKIKEHWDVVQEMSDRLVKNSKNPNPFF